MNWRRFFLEAGALVALAVICAVTANALASRERKLALVSQYPNALKVPAPAPESVEPTASAEPPAVSTIAPMTDTVTPAPAVTPAATTTTAAATAGVATTTATTMASTTTAKSVATPATKPTTPATTASHPPAAAAPAASKRSFPPHPDKAYEEIGYADVAQLHAQGALFLDARRTSVYEQGHIAGARSMPVWESDIDERVNQLYEERSDPREQALPVVIYCSGGDCEDSHMLAQKLWGIQFNNLYVYKDGFPDWQKRGGAIRTGTAR